MKKSLVVLLAVAMLFAFSATAFAATFSDISGRSADAQDSINKLAALKVFNGYEDGTFRPEGNITRAEFAKMASIIGGYATSGDALKGVASQYSDVGTGLWYTGWINLASAQGYVKGDTAGTYRPNDTITEQEVLTILMRILGYNDNLAGPWPVDYINQAIKLGVTDDVTLTGNIPATREFAAIVAEACLDENMVEWSNDIENFTDVAANAKPKTLLEDAFDTASDSGIVDGITGSGYERSYNPYAGWDIDDFEKGQYTLEGVNGDDDAFAGRLADDVVFSTGYSMDNIAGQQVDLIYDTSDDKDIQIIYVDVKSSTVLAKDVEYTGTKLKLDGKTYSLSSDYREALDTDDSGAVDSDEMADAATYLDGNNKKTTFFLDDDNNIYAAVIDKEITDLPCGIVDEVNTSKEKITFFRDTLSLDGDEYIIFRNGAKATLADLQQYDFVAYDEDKGATVLYATDAYKEGTVTRMYTADNGSASDVAVDGTKYKVSSAIFVFDDEDCTSADFASDYEDSAIKYIVGNQNTIVAVVADEAGESNSNYGVILDYTYNTGSATADNSKVQTLTLFTDKGQTVKYDVESGKLYKVDSADESDEIDTACLGRVVKYRVNANGAIDKVYSTDWTNTTAVADTDTDDQTIKLGSSWYIVKDEVKAFNIFLNDDNEIDAELISLADLLDDAFTAGDILYAGDNGDEGFIKNDVNYLIESNKLSVIAVSDFGGSSSIKFAGVTDTWKDSDGLHVKLTNGSEYDVTDGAYDTYLKLKEAKKGVIAYKMSGGDLDILQVIYESNGNDNIAYYGIDGDNGVWVDTDTTSGETWLELTTEGIDGENEYTVIPDAAAGHALEFKSLSGKTMALDGDSVKLASDAVIIYYDDDTATLVSLDDLKNYKGDYVRAFINDDDEADLVVIFDDKTDEVAPTTH